MAAPIDLEWLDSVWLKEETTHPNMSIYKIVDKCDSPNITESNGPSLQADKHPSTFLDEEVDDDGDASNKDKGGKEVEAAKKEVDDEAEKRNLMQREKN